jgi:hypothetical protein
MQDYIDPEQCQSSYSSYSRNLKDEGNKLDALNVSLVLQL